MELLCALNYAFMAQKHHLSCKRHAVFHLLTTREKVLNSDLLCGNSRYMTKELQPILQNRQHQWVSQVDTSQTVSHVIKLGRLAQLPCRVSLLPRHVCAHNRLF